MKDLPPEASSLLDRARVAHEPTSEELARSLCKLHASLDFAPNLTSSPTRAPAARDVAIVRRGLLATRAAKGVLLAVVVGAGVGGASLWFRAQTAPVANPPTVASVAPSTAAPVAPSPDTIDGREHAAHESAPPRQPARPDDVSAAREVQAARTFVVAPTGSSRDKRTPASRSVPALARAARARGYGSGALAPPPAAATGSTPVRVVATQPAQDSSGVVSSPGSRPMPTLPPPVPSELALIDGALTSLRDHAPERSLALLAQHAELYRDGKLATERRGLHVLALCAVGERERAVRERAAYLAGDPRTPMAERVRRTCRPEGEP